MRTRLLLVFALMLVSSPAWAAEFHVAVDGDDTAAGTASQPFASIERARDAVRKLVGDGLTDNVTVWIHAGTYRITEPIVFGPADGGNRQFSVTYAATEGERPVLSGGRVITGWQVARDGAWTAQVPDVKSGTWTFRELFVDGRRAVRARQPNQGFFRVEKVGEDRRTSFQFAPGELRGYRDLLDLELVFLHDWSITRTPVRSIDEASRRLSVPQQIGGPSRWAVMDWFEKQPRYYVENSIELLDAPGEWFLDRNTGTLHYRPRPGESPERVEAVAPQAAQLLVVRGDVEKNRPVENLHFRGLTCRHAAWAPPKGTYWGRQACTYWSPDTTAAGRSHEEADPAAVHFELAESCSFTDGRVEHVGRSGVWLARGCRNNRIVSNVVSDVGGNGIGIGEGQSRTVDGQPWWQAAPQQAAEGNLVANNVVEHCGKELFGAVGIWVGLAGRTSIVHNEVRYLPYTGVSVGWMWWDPKSRPEPRKTPCMQNLVAENHIHHVMQILSDGGGIYTLGLQPGSALRGNVIHDVPLNAGRAESNGMFLDQGTGGFVIERNLIYGIERSPFRFHKGWHNVVRDNVVVLGKDVPLVRYNDTRQERILVENNTVVTSEAELRTKGAEILKQAGLQPEYRTAH